MEAEVVPAEVVDTEEVSLFDRNFGADGVGRAVFAPATPEPVYPTPRVVRADRIQPQAVSWLWPGRLAYGKLSVLDGDPGLGKSTLTAHIAACVTTGRPLPGATPQVPRGVLMLSAEDGEADTIVPRLIAAGADLSRVSFLTEITEKYGGRLPMFPDDVDRLDPVLRENDVTLVVIDPLMAYFADRLDSNRDQHVRRALAPLSQLAEQFGAAVLVVRHLRKSESASALYRGGGSIGIIGAARTGLLMTKDRDDEDRRFLASLKCNIGPRPATLAFRIVDNGNGVAAIEWDGESEMTADELLADATSGSGSAEPRSKVGEAMDFLSVELADGMKPQREILQRAEELGIKPKTLEKAKASLRVESHREGFGPGSSVYWALPPG